MSEVVAVVNERQLLTAFGVVAVPPLFARVGEHASRRYVEFFTATIRNPNTRQAYATALNQFAAWCDNHGLGLNQLQPVVIATYVEWIGTTLSAPTVKQHLAALRMLFDYLVIGQVCPTNPCHAVRGPKYVVRQGMTGRTVAIPQHETLTLSPREAARVLGISQRTLWTHTRSGSVPHVRLGRRILYPIAELKRWLRDTMSLPAR